MSAPQFPLYDVAVIGAGVAGTSAASALDQLGLKVALIDFRERHPPDFRAEKIGEPQVAFFDAFGLGPAARAQLTTFDGVWVHRFGRIVERAAKREYSSPYGDLVNALRGALPASIDTAIGRVTGVETSERTQRVTLSDGRLIEARLLVVATGYGDIIRHKLGITAHTISARHSTAAGFDLANPAADFPFTSLVWITERPADATAYVTIFPMGGRMRANLFVYRAPNDPWCMRFRREPTAMLRELFPSFARQFAPLEVVGDVDFRPMDLMRVENHRQAGVVLIGDAYFTTCPVSGTGIHKALNDVDRLREHAVRWLATPGMGTDKIGQFYDDPAKRQVDEDSLSLALRERAIRMDHTVMGTVRRLRRNVLRRGAYRVRDVLARLHPAPGDERRAS